MNLKRYILPILFVLLASATFTACKHKEDTLPNITGIDNTTKFKVINYAEDGVNFTSQFEGATFQFGISEILQIVTTGAIYQGKWRIENGQIFITNITQAPFSKLNNTWTWSENNAYNIVATAPNGSSTAAISFTRLQ